MTAVKFIELGRDLRARVSAHRHDALSELKWRPQTFKNTLVIYAKANIYKVNEHGVRYRTTITMHRWITKAADFLQVDHDDHDGLNNTDENLVVCGSTYNGTRRRAFGVVGYRGVTLRKPGGSRKTGGYRRKLPGYVAAITDFRKEGGGSIYIGTFLDPVLAARAYDLKALELYGPFFPLNFPLSEYPEYARQMANAAPINPVSDIPF